MKINMGGILRVGITKLLNVANVLILELIQLIHMSGGETPIKLAYDTPFPPDYNFHSKDHFLQENVVKIVKCINISLPTYDPPSQRIRKSENEALYKSDEGSPDGKPRFIFNYTGTRGYKESCLGDAYKNDLLHRIYDASCTTYEDKIEYLDSFSCNVSQRLECRQVGNEPERKFAEQATPIMQCLCPDFNRTQTYLDDETRGYYDDEMQSCVLKVGQPCKVPARLMDKRWEWYDFDYVPVSEDNSSQTSIKEPWMPDIGEGIDVVDFRPMPETQACVKNAFCFVDDNHGLIIDQARRNRCVCESGYFPGRDGKCHHGSEPPKLSGIFIAAIMFAIGLAGFIGGMTTT